MSDLETVRRALADPAIAAALGVIEKAVEAGNAPAALAAAEAIADIGTRAWARGGFRAPDEAEQRFIDALYGADIPSDADEAEIAEALGPVVFRHIRTATAMAAHKPPPQLAERTAWNKPPAARRWLIPDWLPAGRVTLFAGTGGGGKSKLALQLAFGMASYGESWFPGGPALSAEARGGAVCVATYEDEDDEIMRRILDAPLDDNGIAMPRAQAVGLAVGDRLRALDLSPHGPLWGPPRGAHIATRPGLTPAGEAVRTYCEAHGVRLLILDSLAGAYGGSEIDRAAVREFIASWDSWGRANDCATLLIAHPAKGESAAKDGFSGSTDWHNAVRARWYLAPEEGEGRNMVLSHRKSNYGPAVASYTVTGWKWWRAVEAIPASGKRPEEI